MYSGTSGIRPSDIRPPPLSDRVLLNKKSFTMLKITSSMKPSLSYDPYFQILKSLILEIPLQLLSKFIYAKLIKYCCMAKELRITKIEPSKHIHAHIVVADFGIAVWLKRICLIKHFYSNCFQILCLISYLISRK